ncbi:MAG: peptide deformylase [Bacilli bacterium]|nr:peptide deformylase [Bacilli bacterium]
MLDLRKIVTDSDPKIRKKSIDVEFPLSKEDEDAIKYLYDYLVFADDDNNVEKFGVKPGVGLAAPQIGVNKRMFAIYVPYFDEQGNISSITAHAFINPKIINSSIRQAYLLNGEGCLSVEEDHEGYVPRASIVTIKAYDYLLKTEVVVKFRGYEAIIAQHEYDHLEGILYYDRINKKDPFFRIQGALEI